MVVKKQEKEERYFIAEVDQLAQYGNAEGSTREEAERLLDESGANFGDLRVIRGTLLKPRFVFDE